ncbi:MAG: metallophosphoesterase family protein [Saprospiraceae bacterium]|jgi:serine/threonine protein phosphatase 1|nr:metallophosphoesterase family protein [Saprospiraceae bacterium]
MRKFAISDIHGCNQTFNALLKKIEFSKSDQLFLLGDYIDRGPDSKGVLDTIFRLQDSGHSVSCLKGNHEEGLMKSRVDKDQLKTWYNYWGGERTLRSFGTNDLNGIDRRYWRFFEELSPYVEVDDYLLVHAGLNFERKNPLEDLHAMRWIRSWYQNVDYGWLKNRVIVHGHTPKSRTMIETDLEFLDTIQVVNIDNGCFRRDIEMGQLCAFELTQKKLYFQGNIDSMEANYT